MEVGLDGRSGRQVSHHQLKQNTTCISHMIFALLSIYSLIFPRHYLHQGVRAYAEQNKPEQNRRLHLYEYKSQKPFFFGHACCFNIYIFLKTRHLNSVYKKQDQIWHQDIYHFIYYHAPLATVLSHWLVNPYPSGANFSKSASEQKTRQYSPVPDLSHF